MRKWALTALSVLLMASYQSDADASFDTGNDVLRYCTSPKDFDQGMCFGMISGYLDTMELAYSCPTSSKITRQQVRDLAVKDMLADPAQRHLPGHILAVASFVKAFGCTVR